MSSAGTLNLRISCLTLRVTSRLLTLVFVKRGLKRKLSVSVVRSEISVLEVF